VITITLNGETRKVPEEIILDGLIELLRLPRKRVAIELNESVVRRAEWPSTTVRDGDKLEIVHFVGGG
jgi:thiamine biosynthesis protein ThiS